jgi:hypothetical protein
MEMVVRAQLVSGDSVQQIGPGKIIRAPAWSSGLMLAALGWLLPNTGDAEITWVNAPEVLAMQADGTYVDSVSSDDVTSNFTMVTPGATAATSYKLFKYANTASLSDVSTLLRQHGIAEKKVGLLAKSLLEGLKSRPSKALIIGVGVGAATAVVLDMLGEEEVKGEPAEEGDKAFTWLIVIGAGLVAALLYLFLRHKGILS